MATFRGIHAQPGGEVVLTIRKSMMTVRHTALVERSALSHKQTVTWLGIKCGAAAGITLSALGRLGVFLQWEPLTVYAGGFGALYLLLMVGGLFHKFWRSDGDLTWLGTWILCWPVLIFVGETTRYSEKSENGAHFTVLPDAIARAWAGHYDGRPWVALQFTNGATVTYWLLPGNAADVVRAVERLTGGRVQPPPMARA